ncbi:MAG TPA: hypothetical protein VFV38_32830 [Ktedonobacteraceae bacterium]|nr:hypothetical protein [Ktedonobacteraceae bacterium]
MNGGDNASADNHTSAENHPTDNNAPTDDNRPTNEDNSPCGDGLNFASQTLVAIASGEQEIGTLKTGEKVWAYNPLTQKME